MQTQTKAPVAVVTGASRGIGAAIATELARNGFEVALLSRDGNALEQLQQQLLKAGGRAWSFPCDVANRDDVTAALGRLEAKVGVPRVLVNNAGMGGPFHRADEVSVTEWDQLFGVNVDGVRNLCQWALPRMKAEGSGRIVNIASIMGLFGGAQSSTYAATKHALVGYSKAIAAEWGAYGITCNAVCPGYIETEMLAKAPAASRQRLLERIPAVRFGTPEEVAGLVAFLVGPAGGYVNGSALVMDGGLSSHLASDLPSF
ncbi:SDR family NAD(P)-dependent oxidoreductase [Corallococcus aberystwythensis]|uniref:SDR family oxidoreductase n=1 Tax=Corallococcus aberystwythensis TaxID=2316722 RepID=A0A3A8R387_9BACT|nr:SDR family NAD(P)-dependent oxidoreductase [Corallococcus aberystwythensis]RKH74531.1 SDR family oxidoreductase [Corallococcus aberystwythensis]